MVEAVRGELLSPPDLLPSRWVENAFAEGDIGNLALQVGGQISRPELDRTAEIVLARKSRRGLRPLASMTFHQRVLFRALENLLRKVHEYTPRSWDQLSALNRAPLDETPHAAYVIMADISSFYQYVDHDLLQDELVAQTGDASAVRAVGDFLGNIMGRQFGLPQGASSSDFFSEVVIDIAERRLLRQGIRVWRYNDDFRIAARSLNDVTGALEALDHAMREIGLSLNEEKTHAWRRETYRQYVEGPQERWDEIFQGVAVDLADFDFYSGEEIPAEHAVVLIGASEEALGLWRQTAQDAEGAMEMGALVMRRLVGSALAVFDTFVSPGALDYCRDLLSHEPWMTTKVASYMAKLAIKHEDRTIAVLEEILADQRLMLSPWQRAWLLEVPLSAKHANEPGLNLAEGVWQSKAPHVVRARAAVTLAEYDSISLEDLSEFYDVAHASSHPDIVTAMALQAPSADDPILKSVRRDSYLNAQLITAVRGDS